MQPTFNHNQRWRFPAADFLTDEATNWLDGGDFLDYVGVGQGTLYIVFRATQIESDQYIWSTFGDKAHLKILSTGLLQAMNDDGSPSNISFNVPGALKAGVFNIGIWRHFGAQVSVGLNGTRLFSASSGATSGGAGFVRLALGPGGERYGGLICEFLGFADGHKELEMGKVLSFLSSRWQDRGDPHEQAREASSRRMVFLERPRKLVDGAVSLYGADFRPLQKLAVTAPLLAPPGVGGDGTQPWERRVLSLLERDIRYRDREVDLRLGDTREQAHTYRDSGVTTRIADASYHGRMISGRCMARNSGRQCDAWIESDQGTVYKIGPGVERAEGRGVLSESAVTNIVLRSSGVDGTTGLTKTLNGGTIDPDTDTIVENLKADRGSLTALNPATGRLFHAARGEGAFENGRQIHASGVQKKSEALLCCNGLGFMHRYPFAPDLVRWLTALRGDTK